MAGLPPHRQAPLPGPDLRLSPESATLTRLATVDVATQHQDYAPPYDQRLWTHRFTGRVLLGFPLFGGLRWHPGACHVWIDTDRLAMSLIPDANGVDGPALEDDASGSIP